MAALLAAWPIVPGAAPARAAELTAGASVAEDPVPLATHGQITDLADALGQRAPVVGAALERLHENRRVQLFVVYVDDFSGRPAQAWADTTAQLNGLGRDDVLLAVATGTRAYAYSVDEGFRLSDGVLGQVARTSIEPALRRGDWAGAAIGAADGYDAALARPSQHDDSVSASDYVLPVVVLGAAGAVAAYAYARRKHRATTRTTPAATQGAGAGETDGSTPPTALAELDAESREALTTTEDAILTSEEELGFVVAQFGDGAARPFTEAVADARSELAAGYQLRGELDYGERRPDPGDPGAVEARRAALTAILEHCANARLRLEARAPDLHALRAPEQRAPQALEAVETAFRTLTGQTAAADSALTALRRRYAPSATAPVSGHVEEAKERLVLATTALGRAHQALATDDRKGAATCVRAAEGAVAQAAVLVTAVERRGRELADTEQRLPALLAATGADLAEAHRALDAAGDDAAAPRGPVTRAEAVLNGVRQERAEGPYDPIDALRRIVAADAALGEALFEMPGGDGESGGGGESGRAVAEPSAGDPSGARKREDGSRHARTLLDAATLTARAAVAAACDQLAVDRGAVGGEARTRLAEARRLLGSAAAGAASDAPAALASARRADTLARQAQDLAEADVRAYRDARDARDSGDSGDSGEKADGSDAGGGNRSGPSGVSGAGGGR
ncbi:TPM domain-containing protein [Streptomyces sp. cg36]|uniref:TPM domain-containing protein n=1 Tax=Streptomyces sp. cg36 TaxID=3238798 RepID=UPI0034E21914